MDTIDGNVMQAAAEQVVQMLNDPSTDVIHTVTIELNGQHGGADVFIEGYDVDGDEWESSTEVH